MWRSMESATQNDTLKWLGGADRKMKLGYYDGKFWCDRRGVPLGWQVMYWQPLVKPEAPKIGAYDQCADEAVIGARHGSKVL